MKYQQGKIYKIWNDVDDKLYVGSTCQKYLTTRFSDHKGGYADFIRGRNNMKLYQHAKILGGMQHFHIELIENFSCTDLHELRIREGYYQRLLKPELNLYIAGRTKIESDANYRAKNIEKTKEYHAARRKREWDYLNEKFECECGGKYVRKCKERHFQNMSQFLPSGVLLEEIIM